VPVIIYVFNYIFERIIAYKGVFDPRIIIILVNIWPYTFFVNFNIKNGLSVLLFTIQGLITINYKIKKEVINIL